MSTQQGRQPCAAGRGQQAGEVGEAEVGEAEVCHFHAGALGFMDTSRSSRRSLGGEHRGIKGGEAARVAKGGGGEAARVMGSQQGRGSLPLEMKRGATMLCPRVVWMCKGLWPRVVFMCIGVCRTGQVTERANAEAGGRRRLRVVCKEGEKRRGWLTRRCTGLMNRGSGTGFMNWQVWRWASRALAVRDSSTPQGVGA